jgi:acyl-CoA reductase-like NAD-dependent aldehyde dehydrogenase
MANAGQICVAIKRAYVPEALYDPFCDELARLAKEAIVDDGAKQGAQVGPIQNAMQFEKVKALIEDAKTHGTVIAGGAPLDRPGYFIPPTIVRDLPDDAALVREEQFGPVLPVLKYDDIDDVIARANDSEFGLGGSVWGRDVARATDIAKKIDTGTVWVNQYLAIDPNIPFRGTKQSGFGAELGHAGLDEYTQAHVVNAVAFTDA